MAKKSEDTEAQSEERTGLPGTGKATLPDWDEPTRLGVTPRPAVPRNPAGDYSEK